VVVVVALVVLAAPAGAAYTVYVANSVSGNVSAFSVGTDGALSAVSGSPFAAGIGLSAVAVTPDGGHLYVTNAGNASAFSIGASGALALPEVSFDSPPDRSGSVAFWFNNGEHPSDRQTGRG
jgi:DNA-binding beta-propeller fold protein YncE